MLYHASTGVLPGVVLLSLMTTILLFLFNWMESPVGLSFVLPCVILCRKLELFGGSFFLEDQFQRRCLVGVGASISLSFYRSFVFVLLNSSPEIFKPFFFEPQLVFVFVEFSALYFLPHIQYICFGNGLELAQFLSRRQQSV